MSGESVSGVPFAADYRASGILLHVTSLPSPHGIGDLGPTAISWADRLAEAGQSWWQSLPLVSIVLASFQLSARVNGKERP